MPLEHCNKLVLWIRQNAARSRADKFGVKRVADMVLGQPTPKYTEELVATHPFNWRAPLAPKFTLKLPASDPFTQDQLAQGGPPTPADK
jgi:hypothetical protein